MFPQFEIGEDPGVVRDFAQAADELGYAHLTAFDQVVGLGRASRPAWRYVHDADDAFHEVFVLLGFLAAVTRRIELVTGVLVLPMRGTALVAKQAAEIDLLSGGRLRLGVGVGVKPEEFLACELPRELLGRPIDDRERRLDADRGRIAPRGAHVDAHGLDGAASEVVRVEVRHPAVAKARHPAHSGL